MSFYLQGFGLVSVGCNTPVYTLQNPSDTVGTFRMFNYYADTTNTDSDAQAEIAVPGYFDDVAPEFKVADIITAYADVDGSIQTYLVSAVDLTASPKVTLQPFNLGISAATTAKFANDAVTYAKIQDVSAESLLGNPTVGAAAPSEIQLGNGLEFIAGELSIDERFLQETNILISSAEWNQLYSAPLQLTAAAPVGFINVVDTLYLRQRFLAASYAAGGQVALQYGGAVHGAGVAASQSIPAATINGIAASSSLQVGIATSIATATAGQAIFLSNQTADFTTGQGDWECVLTYRTVPRL